MNWVLQKKIDEEGHLLPEFVDDEESKYLSLFLKLSAS